MAEVISNDSLDLPLWMFDFVETTELLTSDIEDHAREETEVLHDILLKAKRLYDRSMNRGDTSSQTKMDDVEAELQRATHITLDSPVPYRIRDVLKLLDHQMGKLENNSNSRPRHCRLKVLWAAFSVFLWRANLFQFSTSQAFLPKRLMLLSLLSRA